MRKMANCLRRKTRYYYLKMVKERGTPEYIARGWAIGMAIGWLIPVGAQLLISLPLAFALKGSKIGAGLGTCITNPVTILLLYPLQCWIGDKIIGGDLSYRFIQDALEELMQRQTREALFRLSGELLTSFFVGGALFALICTPVTYFLVKFLVERFRRLQALRRDRRGARAAGRRHGQ